MMGGLSVSPLDTGHLLLLPRSRTAADSVRNRRAWPVAGHGGQQLATSKSHTGSPHDACRGLKTSRKRRSIGAHSAISWLARLHIQPELMLRCCHTGARVGAGSCSRICKDPDGIARRASNPCVVVIVFISIAQRLRGPPFRMCALTTGRRSNYRLISRWQCCVLRLFMTHGAPICCTVRPTRWSPKQLAFAATEIECMRVRGRRRSRPGTPVLNARIEFSSYALPEPLARWFRPGWFE